MRRVFRLAAYRCLLLAYTFGELAYMVSTVTLSYLVFRRTGSAVGATAFFLSAQFVPAFAGPPIVARLDCRPLRRVLGTIYLAEALVFAALGVFVARFSVVAVIVLAILDGTLTVTARPLVRAAAAEVTSEAGLLREANAVTNIAIAISSLGGPALAGALIAAGGIRIVLDVDAALFVVLALGIGSSSVLPALGHAAAATGGRLRAAAAYVSRHKTVRMLLVMQFVAVTAFTVTLPVEVVYASRSLHAGAAGYGVLLSAWGAGALAGSLAYGRWRLIDAHVLVSASAICLALGMGLMAAAPGLALGVTGAAIAGIGNGVEAVAARTALQEATDRQWMALVMSFAESTQQIAPGIGIVVGGGVAALAGPRPALAVGAAGSFAVALAARVVLGRPRRRLDTAPAGSPPV